MALCDRSFGTLEPANQCVFCPRSALGAALMITTSLPLELARAD
jgi:hypothetical protein